jgi:hypothetical protein
MTWGELDWQYLIQALLRGGTRHGGGVHLVAHGILQRLRGGQRLHLQRRKLSAHNPVVGAALGAAEVEGVVGFLSLHRDVAELRQQALWVAGGHGGGDSGQASAQVRSDAGHLRSRVRMKTHRTYSLDKIWSLGTIGA